MPPKLKARKGNAPKSSKKGKSVAKKRQLPPVHLKTKEETWTTEDEEEPSLEAVLTLLETLSRRMGAYEERLEETTSETTAQVRFTAPTASSTSRARVERTTQSQPLSAPQDGFPDVTEEVRTCITNQLRASPALPIHTDDDTASADELWGSPEGGKEPPNQVRYGLLTL